jgi:hypothetical protein
MSSLLRDDAPRSYGLTGYMSRYEYEDFRHVTYYSTSWIHTLPAPHRPPGPGELLPSEGVHMKRGRNPMSDVGTPALMAEAVPARPAPSALNSFFDPSLSQMEASMSRRFQYIGSSRPSRSRTSTRKFNVSEPATNHSDSDPAAHEPASGSPAADDVSDV